MTNTPASNRVLRMPAVKDLTGLGKSTIYALMTKGEFPNPVKLTSKAVGWREGEVITWLQDREAA